MALTPGEYVFECSECDGSGVIKVYDGESDHSFEEDCDRCEGQGKVRVDEGDAVDFFEVGHEALEQPSPSEG